MATRVTGYIAVSFAALVLSGCSASWDMQGNDPVEYYSDHPIKNKIESRSTSYAVHFIPAQARIAPDEADTLRSQMHGISMAAAESVQIRVSSHDMDNIERRIYMEKFMRQMGYSKGNVTFKVSSELSPDHAVIDIDYAVVVAPDCPDWRTSPVTTYSNSTQGNIGCSQEVNVGLMVADPHDLVGGNGDVSPEPDRSDKAVQNYRAGIVPTSSAAAPAATGSSSSSSSTAATPPSPQ